MKDGMGVRMKGDEAPVAVAKEPEKKASDIHFVVAVFAAFALFMAVSVLGAKLKDAGKRIDALSRASFGEVVKQTPLTLEQVAVSPNSINAIIAPDAWYDEYCIVRGYYGDHDYYYFRLTPEAYAALKTPSKWEAEWGHRFTIYGSAMEILSDRAKAQATAAQPSAK